MWPQRKPFVIEIKKSRRPHLKSPSAQTSREVSVAKKGVSGAPGLTLQREEQS